MTSRSLGVMSLAMAIAVWTGASWAVPPGEETGYLDTGGASVRDEAASLGLGPLDDVRVPEPSQLADFVRDKQAAILLGKALFWDMQVGSDSVACASCHFHAGADSRDKNQLSPGLLIVDDPSRASDPDLTFGDADGLTASGAQAGPNYTVVAGDYPFHKLEDPDDRQSCSDGDDDDGDGLVDFDDDDCFDTNDATSSQGTFDGGFVSAAVVQPNVKKLKRDKCGAADDATFQVGGTAVRKVEPRNSPTTINAVFNHRNFWDGRANNIFNGLNPFGERGLQATPDNPNPGILVRQSNGRVKKVQVRIDNASLASQAVGPPLSDFEMSCATRSFPDLGKKLRPRAPLGFQKVDPNDSVLGAWRAPVGNGLNTTYQVLVQRAFQDKYWAGTGKFDINGDPVTTGGFTQLEVNFSLFFGLAVQLYEATLVSDETPFDAFMEGDDHALDEVEQFGLSVFLNEGKCINCHVGAEFTGATVRLRANEPDGNEEPIERMVMGDGGVALYDGGFYNIGVRPSFEDLGVGAALLGFPLSFARQAATGNVIDDFDFDTDKFEVPGPIVLGERVAVDGAFKTPTLRNAELTGPYFHNGNQATLAQVVDFYDRGGDRLNRDDCDTTGFAENCSNLDPDIQRLGLDDITREIDGYTVTGAQALVRFMLTLTDDRVRHEKAPFDHPQIFVPNGHTGNQFTVIDDGTGRALHKLMEIPAVGANGNNAALEPFLGLDPEE
jgi:cytochrome c peroxidase